jgi:SAM-dependent methyltransferase
MDADSWRRYIAEYHHERPGITETVLDRSSHPELGTPHRWLAQAVSDLSGPVVDVACGSAPIRQYLPMAAYVGVDLNEAELQLALSSRRQPVVRADALELPLRSQSVAAVVISMALMLLPVPVALLEAARVLQPGGTLAVLVPSVWPVRLKDLPAVAVLSAALVGPGSMPQQLSARRLSAYLNQAGFEVQSAQRARFELEITQSDDAELAVRSLYTPHRRAWQRRIAVAGLHNLPGQTTLPVPLLRVVAQRR